MTPVPPEPSRGAWMVRCAVVGVIGLALTAVGFAIDRRPAAHAYLLAFTYWAGIATATLVWLMAFHATAARWMVVLRRALETITLALPVLALLFVPVALSMGDLYSWVHPDAHGFTPHELELLRHKSPYLNPNGFVLRTAAYFVVWILIAEALARWSRQQDQTADARLVVKMRRLGAAALPACGLAMTFASVDWVMSLNPLWQSTLFGAYSFAGSFLGAMCVLVIVTTMARGAERHGELVTPEHFHSLGKLMLAFTAFWAYLAFSQFMLIWAANLPEENGWYLARQGGPWTWVGVLLIAGQFALPLFVLLFQDLKRRPRMLSAIAAWQLLLHFVDLHWQVNGGTGLPAIPHWTNLTAMLGVGGCVIAVALWRARGVPAVPVKDPFLADSLRYVQP